ncbi:MAG: divalent-cation tolerance protein CutA [Robiginitomaculum sp.]|nr:divalent-cation tolerance protein CutA [Robiginitomaculum sp.]
MAFLIYSTWPDSKTAQNAVEQLLRERLIACANISQSITSMYRWKGKLCKESEVQVWLKTGAKNTDELQAEFLRLHPYEVPAFLVISIDEQLSHQPFMNWLQVETDRENNG